MSDTSSFIPFLRPSLPRASAYAAYLNEIDENGWYSNFGPLNERFEQRALDEYFSGRGAMTTVGNCTLGLMLALSVMKRPGGKYVVMPSFTFAATALAAVWAGLTPYFVDISPDDWVAESDAIDAALAELGDDVAAVVVYNTFGNAIDLGPLAQIHQSGVPVIIDAAPSFGAKHINGSFFGQDFPGAVVFSLHATKPFGIGEGGLVYSADANLIARIRSLSNFGFESPGVSTGHGFNAKLPEVLAAVALAVLDVFPQKLQRLAYLFDLYLERMTSAGILEAGVSLQRVSGEMPHQFMPILIPENLDVDLIEQGMRAGGVGVRRYFMPSCHSQVQMEGFPHADLSVTEAVSGRVICLPLWDGMSEYQVDKVVAVLHNQVLSG